MIEFKYISNFTLDEIEDNNVFPCIDEDGFSNIIIKNSLNKLINNNFETDNLSIKLNRLLKVDEQVFYVHIIKSKKSDLLSRKKFEVIYQYIFNKILQPISSNDLYNLLISIEEYFKITPESDNQKFQIGLYGELFTIKMLYENGYTNIVNKYHKNFYSKHDFEINDKNRIEIKTTVGDKRIHVFKHNQICRDDIRLFVVSILLEKSQNGLSLYKLIEYVKNITPDADLKFELDKLFLLAGLSEDKQGLVCSEKLTKDNMKFILANNIPHLDKYNTKVDGVFNIQYECDCELSESIDISNVVEILNKL